MIVGINRKLGTKSPFAYLRRDIYGTLREHHRLYPHSRLRIAFIGWTCLLAVSCGLTYIFIRS